MTKVKDPDKDKRCRKIVAVAPDGSMMGCFDTIKLACEKYGLTKWLVRRSCKTGKIYRGIRWIYEDEYHTLWLQGREKTLAYTLPEWQKPLQRGDLAGKGVSEVSMRTYCRTLTKKFGAQATLAEVARQLGMT